MGRPSRYSPEVRERAVSSDTSVNDGRLPSVLRLDPSTPRITSVSRVSKLLYGSTFLIHSRQATIVAALYRLHRQLPYTVVDLLAPTWRTWLMLFFGSQRIVRPLIVVILLLLSVSTANAQTSSREARNLIGLELLGRAGIYSVNYERLIKPRVGFGLGVARWSTQGCFFTCSKSNTVIVPLYVSWNPVGDTHSLYVAAGTTLKVSKVDRSRSTSYSADAIATATVGYQYRSSGGFLIRPTVSRVVGPDWTAIWPGVTMGFTF